MNLPWRTTQYEPHLNSNFVHFYIFQLERTLAILFSFLFEKRQPENSLRLRKYIWIFLSSEDQISQSALQRTGPVNIVYYNCHFFHIKVHKWKNRSVCFSLWPPRLAFHTALTEFQTMYSSPSKRDLNITWEGLKAYRKNLLPESLHWLNLLQKATCSLSSFSLQLPPKNRGGKSMFCFSVLSKAMAK